MAQCRVSEGSIQEMYSAHIGFRASSIFMVQCRGSILATSNMV